MIRSLMVVAVLGLVFIVACEKDSTMNPSYPFLQNPSAESVDYVPDYISDNNQVFYENMPDSTRAYYMPDYRESCLVKAEFNHFIINADTAWTWVDSEVRDELEEWESHIFYYSIASYVSNRMLWFQLLGGGSYTTAKKEAIQFYVNLALQHNNPDAEMMANALIILHDGLFWSTARVKTAADSANGFADEYLALSNPTMCNCEDTTGSTAGYITDALNAMQSKQNLIINAQTVLDSLTSL